MSKFSELQAKCVDAQKRADDITAPVSRGEIFHLKDDIRLRVSFEGKNAERPFRLLESGECRTSGEVLMTVENASSLRDTLVDLLGDKAQELPAAPDAGTCGGDQCQCHSGADAPSAESP
jgi:hypothetical protein